MDVRVSDGSIGSRTPRRRLRISTILVALLFLMAEYTQTTLAATISYSGYTLSGNQQGIRAYILQPDSGTINSPNAILSWVGLCSNNCANFNYYNGAPDGPVWVQLGMYQGVFAAGTSTTVVHVYYENMTPCGDYHADDVGIPVTNPYFFSVQYAGGGQLAFNCDTVQGPFLGYKFGYRKGAESSDFFTGWMTTTNGRADANTETHNTPSQATVYFGCASTATCLSAYGVAYRTLTQWGLCCPSQPNLLHNNPPYLKIINNWYSFKTCQTSGACT